VIVRDYFLPADPGHVFDGAWNGEPGGEIARSLPVEFLAHALAELMADDQGMDLRLPVGPAPQERAALGRAGPFVEIAGVIGRGERGHVEVEHAGGMGAVHEHVDAAVGAARQDFFDREHQCGGRSDVIDHQQSGARRQSIQNRLLDDAGRFDGRRDVDFAISGAGSIGDVFHRLANGVVNMRSRQQLVARRKTQRTKNAVDAFGGVGDESEIPGVHSEPVADRMLGGLNQFRSPAGQQFDGIGLDSLAPAGVLVENDAGRGSE